MRRRCREALVEARERTLALVADVAADDLDRIHSPLMSPLAWDLGHVAAYEDLWLCRAAGGLELLRPDLAEVYDASETPRSDRAEVPYLRHREALDYLAAVRERALGVLERADLCPDGDRLNAGGFVWDLVIQHEHQHGETMLQTLQLAEPGTFAPPRPQPPPGPGGAGGRLAFDGGPFELGDPGVEFAYDNERPRHRVELAPFEIDRAPVSNGAYAEFVADGGYERPELWTAEGWAWREREGAAGPLYWTADGGERRFDRVEPLDPRLPAMHVCRHEADAYARWAGGRLPTEAEWERAATAAGGPHGRLDQLAFGPSPSGAFVGDCWEWTASAFGGYPGFEPFPYREYSEVFFDAGYRVLRGASWATRPSMARPTFRNWDLPHRRQLFAGFRCAYDPAPARGDA